MANNRNRRSRNVTSRPATTRRRKPDPASKKGRVYSSMSDKKKKQTHRKDTISVVSLFSSFGLGDLGVRAAGGRILAMAEMEESRCEFLRRNYPDAQIVQGDIWETKDEVVRRVRETLGDEELFLVVATPPCQGMSPNGMGSLNKSKREGKRAEIEARNELILPGLDVIKQLRPLYVFFENVVEMRTTRILYKGKQRFVLDVIAKELGFEYVGKDEVVAFSAYGVPQNRERLISVYTRDSKGTAALKRDGTLLPPRTHARPITLRKAIGHFEELDGRTAAKSEHDPLHRVKKLNQYHAVSHTPEGCTAFNNPCSHCGHPNDSMPRGKGKDRRRIQCKNCRRLLPRPKMKDKATGRWVATKGFPTSHRRMWWDKPAPTATKNLMVASSDNKLHPEQNRTLSPAEVQVLQTVDRYAYDWGKNPTDKELGDALGEAVPPLFFEKLTRHLVAISTGTTDPVKLRDGCDREPRPATARTNPTTPPARKKASARRRGRATKPRNPIKSKPRGRKKAERGTSAPSRPTTKEDSKRGGNGD